MMHPAPTILGVILAGGGSRRFGSDKAFARLAGTCLIEHVAHRARPQVSALAVSRGEAGPLPIDVPVIVDRDRDEGPLSGLLSSLRWAAAHDFALVATFPCDGPFFPTDLVARLSVALGETHHCAIARCGENKHFTYGLWRTAVLPPVEQLYVRGKRSLYAAVDALTVTYAEFPMDTFFNVNSPQDLLQAEALLAQRSG